MSEEKKEEILEQEKELDKDELEAVAGGSACACVVGGYGSADGSGGDCNCAFGGYGGRDYYGDGSKRCVCPMVGGGVA